METERAPGIQHDTEETTESDTATDVDATVSDSGAFRDSRPRDSALRAADVILIAHPENQSLGNRYRLAPYGTLTVGRDGAVDISLPEVRSVSRLHACVRHLGDRVEIEDLGSTNGTFLNDRAVDQVEGMASGDRFQIGAVHFKFLHERDPEHAYHEAIHQLVVSDGLTQIFNKRKFDEELARELARAQRHERPLGLILIDLDHFKRINDTRGHLCGDAILQQIAQRVQGFLRAEQVFARVGGEEMAILCPETHLEGAAAFAERLRADIAARAFPYGDRPVRLTASFGVAALEASVSTGQEMYEAADRALYAAKGQGRNRVSRYKA